MAETACQLVVAQNERALTAEEHAPVLEACRELWQIANPTPVYRITTTGKRATAVAGWRSATNLCPVHSGRPMDPLMT